MSHTFNRMLSQFTWDKEHGKLIADASDLGFGVGVFPAEISVWSERTGTEAVYVRNAVSEMASYYILDCVIPERSWGKVLERASTLVILND